MKTDVRLHAYLGGRVAEELVFGDVSTGAEKELEQVTALARQMAARCGMSAKLGVANFACDDPGGPWLHAVVRTERCSDATVRIIEEEVRLLLDEARQRVTQTLRDKRVMLDRIAAFSLEREVLDHAALVSLGIGVALAFGIINAMWLQSRSDFISDH
jgi:cell division protease FtsH